MKQIWDDLDKLGIFVTVAEKGKINDAADTLNLTQPSISRAIQKLEESFGCELFVRSRAGVKLTRAGRLLYDRASALSKELQDLRSRAQNEDDDIAGSLIAGTYESLAEYLWPDFLISLKKNFPKLLLSIQTSHRADPIVDLIAGRIDLLVDAEPQTKGDLVSWPLYSDRFAFYAAPGADLKSVLYVQGAYDENRVAIENHLERSGLRFEREYCFDSFSTAKRLAIRKMGVAVLPIRLAHEDEKKKLISRVEMKGFSKDGFGRHTIYATVADQNEREPRIRKVISLLKEHFR